MSERRPRRVVAGDETRPDLLAVARVQHLDGERVAGVPLKASEGLRANSPAVMFHGVFPLRGVSEARPVSRGA